MKAWYVPTFNGDLRLEPAASPYRNKKTKLSIVDPTPLEKKALVKIGTILLDRGWIKEEIAEDATEVLINAPLEKVGPEIVNVLRPGPAVLSAVKFKDGHIEIVEHRDSGVTSKELEKVAEKEEAEAAATVNRPTPCCPNCFVDACAPATESLLAFLTVEQHGTWARDRYIVVRGGLTGHVYILAHRSSMIAERNGRICWDATDRGTLHFHDQSVPPEEEVLAAMLILMHREHWLRNEATCLGWAPNNPSLERFTRVFKNPFGDISDGVADSQLTAQVGVLGMAAMLPQ